jgi:uncharacterized protein YtpQ (UPF0354 family)
MLYRTIDEIILAALQNTKERMREVAAKNTRKAEYNKKNKKRLKK